MQRESHEQFSAKLSSFSVMAVGVFNAKILFGGFGDMDKYKHGV